MPSYSGVWNLNEVFQAVGQGLWPYPPLQGDIGLFGGGYNSGAPGGPAVNVIDYINIETTGNATDFGDLTVIRYSLGGCSSSTRGVFGGGNNGSNRTNVIDYITIATVGNATETLS